jgi:Gluconate 2-dehydrogenase subunit 3
VPTAQWTPAFLDQHQSDTLTVLGERIIPGSSKAQVNRFIDLLLSVDTQDAQKKFLRSLSAFEAESLHRFSQPYKDLSEAQQNEILSDASTAHPGKAGDGQPEQVTMRDHFENIKSWVSDAYYSSEIGMKELGWTGEVFFTSFPGCQESNGH